MMNTIDLKYCGIASTRLERFRLVTSNPYRANFRCPICGDSQKSKSKARGWFLGDTDHVTFYCHNCNASMILGQFLKNLSFSLYEEYHSEWLMNKLARNKTTEPTPKKKDDITKIPKNHPDLKGLKKLSALNIEHPARKYVTSRGIPSRTHHRLFYTSDFNGWVNKRIPNKLKDFKDARLVIPCFDINKRLIGVSGRSLEKNPKIRYITITFDYDTPMIFGIELLDSDSPFYVVEGQLDSLFLRNAIAMGSSSVDMSHVPNTENAVMVYDNEPRNTEILDQMEKSISGGYKIVIWPSDIRGKDINEMILNGHTNIEDILEENTYSGLMANLKFREWKKR